MPLVKTRPMRFRPRSLADTLDGNNEAEGACSALVNLIQDPSTPSCLQCRPAAQVLSKFAGFNAPGIVSQALEVNDRVYGFIASNRNSGHDEPFVYSLTTGSFLTVNGITAANAPLTQPSTGDWVPPTMIVVGTKIICTHPGFAGLGNGNVLGYFDVSNYTQTQLGNITSGSNQITGNMSVGALGPGYNISGAGIPAGTTVTNLQNATPQSTGNIATGGVGGAILTSGSNVLADVTGTMNLLPGQTISGTGIPLNTTIASISGNSVTMSANATSSSPTTTTSATVTSGSNVLTAVTTTVGFNVGQPISGTGIPANTLITAIGTNTITMSANATATNTGVTCTTSTYTTITATGNLITSVAAIAGFAVGQVISGVGIPSGTTITAISGSNITISNTLTATATGSTISASGTIVTMSANASATTLQENITIAGGTTGTPLWCAGNTTNIQLNGYPTNVNNFNNRAYISVGQYLTLCDPLSLNVSQPTQALVVGDVSPITALQPLTIINPATSAPVQGLLVFKQNLVTLVTGDPTTNSLANNTLSPSGVGTTSPNAVWATTSGVYFIDVDGLRCVELSGNITDPLPDVRVPFINAINRTRISAAYNAGIYRVCLQRGDVSGTPWQEFWFDLKYRLWTGPHTFQQQVILPWKGSFVAFSNAYPATLYQSDPVQTAFSNFIENGSLLSWTYSTSALPDNEDLMYNSLVVASINVAFKAGAPTLQCIATDENGTIVGLASIVTPGAASYWGTMVWGTNVWYGQQYGLQPRQIPWTAAVVFSKLVLTITAPSSLGFQISNFQALYQPLGYVNTPVGVAVNSAPVNPPPPVSYLWDAGYLWDTVGLNWQG